MRLDRTAGHPFSFRHPPEPSESASMPDDETDLLFDSETRSRLERCGFVAVLVIDRLEDVDPLARALLEGGIHAMELTLRTPVALDAIARIHRDHPDMTLGVGTVLRPEQVDAVQEAGAHFAVSPGLNPRVVERARERGLSFSPGVMTPSEIEIAVELGGRFLKYFPAETAGGLDHLNTAGSPFAHLDLRYLPLGGLHPGNLAGYLEHPWIGCAGGSWIAPRESILERDWSGITARARQTRDLIDRIRQEAG